MMRDEKFYETVVCSATIVSAYVTSNAIPASDLSGLILSTHAVLQALVQRQAVPAVSQPQKGAVSIRKSVTEDYIVCLEDGRRFKSMKRHLRVRYGMTPEQYRSKWRLPAEYPMVAPGYAQKRSRMAKSMGLGLTRGQRISD